MASAKEIPELAQRSNSYSQQEKTTSHTPENPLVSANETNPSLQNQDSDLPQDGMHPTAQPYSKPVPAGRYTSHIQVPARYRPRTNSIALRDDLHREHARDHGSGRSDHRPVSSLENQSHVAERRGSRPSIRSDFDSFSQRSSQITVSVYNPSEQDSVSQYVPSESSVASSAHSVTRGFVDCETHAPLDIRSSGPKVHSDFVDPTGTTDVAIVVERIRKAKNVSERRYYLKTLQGAILPRLSRKRNIRGVAQCMLVNDMDIQEMAASLLQRHLLQLTNRNDEEFTEELLAVAESTRAAFDQSNDKDAHAHLLGLLHLMVLSALLTRCPKPSTEQCAPLLFLTEGGKQKTVMSSAKQEMTSALCVFSKTFNTCLHETSCPLWANTDMNQNTTRKMFRTASTTERLVFAYTLLNEVSAHARQELSVELLGTLSDLKDAFHKYPTDSKGKEKACVRFAFHLLLVRGLTFLLDTTFKEALIPVGEPAHDLTRLIVNLIVDILESDRGRQGFDRLEQETLILPFHRDPFVRRTFSLFLQGHPQHSISISNVKHHLRKYRFCRTGKAKPKCVSKSCEWYEADCAFQDTEARLVMLVLQHACLAEGPDPKQCLVGHFEESVKTSADVRTTRRQAAERARSFQHNLDMLVKLSHDCTHLLSLYAFQYSPFPFFITEATQNRRLLRLLLTHREARKWLKRDVLLLVLCQVVEALLFLKQKDIVLRDVTCFNMLVEARKRDAGALDILPSASFVIKVVDLGQARHVTDPVYPYVSILKVAAEDQEPVPVRWISPEALKDGEYSHKSEVYSAGCVGSELFTHGNQPFSSYDSASTTEELLLKMLQEPGSVTLHHWPCIPDDVFDLISRCTLTDSRKRPTLQCLADELKNLQEQSHTREDGQSVFDFEAACNYPNRYPPLSPVQLERNNMPEKEIPSAVKQFIAARDPGESGHRHSGSRGKCRVTKEELKPPDSITIENKDSETVVTEKVSEKWCVEVLPALEANSLLGVTCWNSLNKTIQDRDTSSARLKQHERRYPPCIDLLSAAKCHCLWNNTQFSLDEGYAGACSPDLAARCYHVLESLTHAVLVMHEQGFCHCDIKAANILIERHTGNVVLPRIGRVCRLTSPEALVSTSVYEDSLRWLAPEVALGLDYANAWCGPASDIYMLGTTIWELYNVRQLTATDPAADARHLAPFPSVPKNQLVGDVTLFPAHNNTTEAKMVCSQRVKTSSFVREVVLSPKVVNVSRSDGSLEKPQDCPHWLYDLICQCRHPDHAKRPSCQDILNALHQHRDSAPLPSPFWTDANSATTVRSSHSSGDGDGSRGASGLLKKFQRRGKKPSGSTFYAPADPDYYTLDESRIARGTSRARVDSDEGSDQMFTKRVVKDDDGNESAPQLPARNRMAKGPGPGTPDPRSPYSVPSATATSRGFSAGRSSSPEPDYESD